MLTQFIVFNILNVIIQTIKSIATVKCGKVVAAVVNAVAYGLYTYIVILTMCELSTITKAVIVAVCNLIGVYVVKLFEEKARKDRLWKVEATILRGHTNELHKTLIRLNIPHNYLENVGKYTLFNIFCETQKQSRLAKEVLDLYKAKYFVTESKTL